jgi:hypothetical protein
MIAATRAHVKAPKRAQASWSNSRVAQQQCTLTEYELYSCHAKPSAIGETRYRGKKFVYGTKSILMLQCCPTCQPNQVAVILLASTIARDPSRCIDSGKLIRLDRKTSSAQW